jgi:hypothetical protein
LLREPSRAALALVELAPLQRTACGSREIAGQLEVIVAEPRVFEEDDDQAVAALRRLHRHGKQGAVAGRRGDLAPVGLEPVVLSQRRGRDHRPVARARSQRLGATGRSLPNQSGHLVRQPVSGSELEGFLSGHQQRRRAAAEGFCRGPGDCAQRLGLGNRQRQQRGDVVERTLGSRLPRALFETLGIAKGKSRERRERLEQLGIGAREGAIRIMRADPEDAANLIRPHHRCHDRACVAAICRVRNRVRQLGVIVREGRPALPDRPAGKALV